MASPSSPLFFRGLAWPLPLMALALAVTLCGCPSDECKGNAECPEGQHCGANGFCTLDCRKSSDCAGGGTCNSLGKCVGGSLTDAGGMDAKNADKGSAKDLPPGVDLGGADGPAADSKVIPDLYVLVPDKQKAPDMAPKLDTGPTADLGPVVDGLDAGGGTDSGLPPTGVVVNAGTFTMGSSTSENCRDATNETEHQVTLSKKFEIMPTEVTRAEFYALMAYNPSKVAGCTSSCPVENVSWSEAAAYCNALSKAKSLTPCYTCSGSQASVVCDVASAYQGSGAIYGCPGFRLPTDAEWEFAARAGSTTALHNGQAMTSCTGADTYAGLIGWYDQNSSGTSHPVKGKAANSWTLYDMSGNVMEWTNDWYEADLGSTLVTNPSGTTSGTSRVVRGGGWYTPARYLRSASRMSVAPTGRSAYLGFRVARTL